MGFMSNYITNITHFIWSNWVLRTTRGSMDFLSHQSRISYALIHPRNYWKLVHFSVRSDMRQVLQRRYSVRKHGNMTWGKLEIWNLMKFDDFFFNFNEIMNNYNYTLRTPNITWHVKASFCFSRVLWDSRFFGDLDFQSSQEDHPTNRSEDQWSFLHLYPFINPQE